MANENKWVSNNGLLYFLNKLKDYFVAKQDGKGLSTNDLTNTLKSNYDAAYTYSQAAHAPSDAEKNIIVEIQKNGAKITPDANRKVNITVPTKTSDITNDSGFITSADVPEGVIPSTTTPKANGTAAVGTENAFSRGDHVHPSDTSKVDKITGKGLSTNDYTTAEKNKLAGIDENANNYSLPDASSSAKGGVIIGTNISVSSGTISVANGSTSAKGVVQLSDATNGTSTTKAATENAVKKAYDLASGKQSPATTLSGYGITDAYTKTEIDNKLTSAVKYKGTKASYSELPTTGQLVGDMYNITAADPTHGIKAGDNVVWSGTDWDVQGGTTDLSGCVQTSDAMTNAEIDALFT